MFEDVKGMADQIGWPLAIGLFALVMAQKAGILSIKIGGKGDGVAELRDDIQALKIQIARIETILEERFR